MKIFRMVDLLPYTLMSCIVSCIDTLLQMYGKERQLRVYNYREKMLNGGWQHLVECLFQENVK